MTYIICSDDIKQTLPGYNPAEAERFHVRSTALADHALEHALHTRPERKVILMSGGSASGKSEYVSAYLSRRQAIVSDGTFSSSSRAEDKIRKALAAGKQIEICAVWPADFRTAFQAFSGRERQFAAEHFYRTHSQSRRTLLFIAHRFPLIPITLVISDYSRGESTSNMIFREQESENRRELIEFISQNQYTESSIKIITGEE